MQLCIYTFLFHLAPVVQIKGGQHYSLHNPIRFSSICRQDNTIQSLNNWDEQIFFRKAEYYRYHDLLMKITITTKQRAEFKSPYHAISFKTPK